MTHSSPTPDSQTEKALAIQAVQAVKPRRQQPAHVHKASKLVLDKVDEATVRQRTVAIVDELVQSKDFKVLDLSVHQCSPQKL